jgi:hypothetical protein
VAGVSSPSVLLGAAVPSPSLLAVFCLFALLAGLGRGLPVAFALAFALVSTKNFFLALSNAFLLSASALALALALALARSVLTFAAAAFSAFVLGSPSSGSSSPVSACFLFFHLATDP